MKAKIPDFVLELAKQMKSQPTRSTAHPFWQVRCERFLPTAEGYNSHHWILVDDDGEFFRSDVNVSAASALKERHPEFCSAWEAEHEESFEDVFDVDSYDLPDAVNRLYVQSVEEVLSTHFTEHDAEWFIQRCQHHYRSKLYTYVESAYWSPQIKQLQDWILSLAPVEPAAVTDTQKRLLQHMLGADSRYSKKHWGFRNRYCTSPDHDAIPELEKMRLLGLVESTGSKTCLTFFATRAGAEAIGFKKYQLVNAGII